MRKVLKMFHSTFLLCQFSIEYHVSILYTRRVLDDTVENPFFNTPYRKLLPYNLNILVMNLSSKSTNRTRIKEPNVSYSELLRCHVCSCAFVQSCMTYDTEKSTRYTLIPVVSYVSSIFYPNRLSYCPHPRLWIVCWPRGSFYDIQMLSISNSFCIHYSCHPTCCVQYPRNWDLQSYCIFQMNSYIDSLRMFRKNCCKASLQKPLFRRKCA